jgi:hypothetical protein
VTEGKYEIGEPAERRFLICEGGRGTAKTEALRIMQQQFVSRLHRPGNEKLTIWVDEIAEWDESVLRTLRNKGETAIRELVKANVEQEIETARLRAKGAKPARTERGPQGDGSLEGDV